MKIGVISDTHGLLRPQAVDALAGSDLILHAGDIGKPAVLEALKEIAPVIAVRGNNAQGTWADVIAEREIVEIGEVSHILKDLSIDPQTAGIQVVISGHSHKPLVEERNGVLFLNPGSAEPRRFKLPITLAHLHLDGTAMQAQIIELDV
ncbi:metallophosphoesterase family protein [Phormidium sp. CLA17]|uniref:metallophosphoesterase family protein n=1 Tax=Leptolyngbya sp. Cla-17 TaxID=2803751 RepID=UPI001492E143|nr:metallophosphoesterase family protein [Leptolyngbya sp. Cla-17]MBM0744634.1 metallophosphoesterase family protein [Leptolyngbya sp. Cla-17]